MSSSPHSRGSFDSSSFFGSCRSFGSFGSWLLSLALVVPACLRVSGCPAPAMAVRAALGLGAVAAPAASGAAAVTAVPLAVAAPDAATLRPGSTAPAAATPGRGAQGAAGVAPGATAPAAGGPPLDTAGEAEALTRAWRASGDAAELKAIERPAVALFPYGHGRPVLRCAPLRACAVELEPAETLLATATGDSERWLIQTAASGAGGRTSLVLVKPTACDISTNLVISTDRRVYELTLDSPPCRAAGGARSYNPRLPYTGLLRFYYPDDLVRRWADAERSGANTGPAAEHGGTATTAGIGLAPGTRLSQLNFDYTWQRDRRFPWTPSQIFDDGEHTYILLPEAARHAEAPALLAAQADGALALVNYRLEGQTYITDRVLERAVMVVGAGRRRAEQKLEIVNRAARPRHPNHAERPADAGPAGE
jgi:P-type conjugative transfer protein TrbG